MRKKDEEVASLQAALERFTVAVSTVLIQYLIM